MVYDNNGNPPVKVLETTSVLTSHAQCVWTNAAPVEKELQTLCPVTTVKTSNTKNEAQKKIKNFFINATKVHLKLDENQGKRNRAETPNTNLALGRSLTAL